eukprot:2607608-Prymnesium_polylepis.2
MIRKWRPSPRIPSAPRAACAVARATAAPTLKAPGVGGGGGEGRARSVTVRACGPGFDLARRTSDLRSRPRISFSSSRSCAARSTSSRGGAGGAVGGIAGSSGAAGGGGGGGIGGIMPPLLGRSSKYCGGGALRCSTAYSKPGSGANCAARAPA